MVIPSPSDAALDLPTLLLQWQDRSPANGENDFVFMDCPLIGTAKCLNAKVHLKKVIDYAKYKQALSQWMAPYVGTLNAIEFLRLYGTESGRSRGATTTCNARVPQDAWREQGD